MLRLDSFHLARPPGPATSCPGDVRAAGSWAAERLAEIKTSGAVAPVLAATDALWERVRWPAKLKAADGLRQHLIDRLERLDCRTVLVNGWDAGSGPTEAMCQTPTLRPDRPGMKRDGDRAAGRMDLQATYEAGQADIYGPRCRPAARRRERWRHPR